MPRIIAPTLAQHRDLRHASLLTAARDLALESGGRSVTMAKVAERTGLSRPAVYEYFPSVDALLAALVVAEMQSWSIRMQEVITSAGSPQDKVCRYLEATLTAVAEGQHRLARAIGDIALAPEAAEQLSTSHRQLADPLSVALSDLGCDQPIRCAELLQGVLEAATRRVERGADPEAEIAAVQKFVLAGVLHC